MTPIAFLRELVSRGMAVEDAVDMAEVFERQLRLEDMLDVAKSFVTASVTADVTRDAMLRQRSPAAERQARYRQRKMTVTGAVSPDVTGVTEGVTRDVTRDADGAEIPSPEKVSPTPPLKQTPSLPSGDKSPSGNSPGARTREAPPSLPDWFDDEPTPDTAQLEAQPLPSTALVLVGELLPAAPKPKRLATVEHPDFERFWQAYPRKIGKGEARKAFGKAVAKISGPAPPIEVMLRALADAVQSWTVEGRELKHIPHATTWLNQERWTDEHGPFDGGPGTGAPKPSDADRRFQQMVRGAEKALARFG